MRKFKKSLALLLAVLMLIIAGVVVEVTNRKQISGKGCAELSVQNISSTRALGLIIDNRKLLAIKLSGEKNYSPPGGHTNVAEKPEEALTRELQEEIGLSPNEISFVAYNVGCERNNGLVERTHYYQILDWSNQIEPANRDDKIKWVDYDFRDNKRADSELIEALELLKADELID